MEELESLSFKSQHTHNVDVQEMAMPLAQKILYLAVIKLATLTTHIAVFQSYLMMSLCRYQLPIIILCLFVVNGCATYKANTDDTLSNPTSGGGYYQNDGPGSLSDINLEGIANAVPRLEKINLANSKPYTAVGQRFVPMQRRKPYKKRGQISWYGKQFHGRKTANGETYSMYEMTAAHPTLPLPSYARVTNLKNGKSVIVRVNDRGPFLHGRIMDLSYVAAAKLGYINSGTTEAEVEAITDFSSTQSAKPVAPSESIAATVIKVIKVPPAAFSNEEPKKVSSINTFSENGNAWLSRSQVTAKEIVQVGAFSSAHLGNNMVAKLYSIKSQWPNPKVKIFRVKDKKQSYKIWVAEFNNAHERVQLQRLLLSSWGIDSFRIENN